MATKAKKKRKITPKQQKFIDCYDGDIKKAAEKAKISYDYGRQLYTKSHILKAIKDREKTENGPRRKRIAIRQERQEFWSKAMRDSKQSMKDRLKASELLGKSEADFTEKHKHGVDDGLAELLKEIGRFRVRLPRDET